MSFHNLIAVSFLKLETSLVMFRLKFASMPAKRKAPAMVYPTTKHTMPTLLKRKATRLRVQSTILSLHLSRLRRFLLDLSRWLPRCQSLGTSPSILSPQHHPSTTSTFPDRETLPAAPHRPIFIYKTFSLPCLNTYPALMKL